ncbi:MAG: AgmX/PglI C-terminal domain-containing protein [Deltaproteobacteria bacterium]|nr:AgmX/PglI C-terminal domain-containing protein [Deltaproteobacteria bacterium]
MARNLADLPNAPHNGTPCVEVRVYWQDVLRSIEHCHKGRGYAVRLGSREVVVLSWERDVALAHGSEGPVPLPSTHSVRTSIDELSVVLRSVQDSPVILQSKRTDRALLASHVFAAMMFLTLGGIASQGVERSELLIADNGDDRLADLRALIASARDRTPPTNPSTEGSAWSPQPAGQAPGPVGQRGAYEAPRRRARSAVRDRGLPPQLAQRRVAAPEVIRGVIASLGGREHPTPNEAPENIWGGLTASGFDARDAWGNTTTDGIGDAFGFGGLGRIRTGVGGGGPGSGATCDDSCVGANMGFGQGFGAMIGVRRDPSANLPQRQTRAPILRPTPMTVRGSYPREAIRRIVLRNMGQVQHCYEQGVALNPDLSGRVVLQFVIAPNGQVLSSNVAERTLMSATVASCIANAARRWVFPSPDEVIDVTYPFLLRVD